MKYKIFSQAVTLLIIISLLLTGTVLPLSAADDDRLSTDGSCKISDYVDASEFDSANHIKRLADEETLDTYVFENADGGKSVYMFSEDVKYIDKDGKIIEKDISLTEKTDGYGTKRNNVDLLIPKSPEKGVNISYSGYSLKLIPQDTERSEAEIKDNSVVYGGIFGENTELIYTPMLSGIKEDITVAERCGSIKYAFILETNGLGLYNCDRGRYYLAESVNSDKYEPIFEIDEIIIYDAAGGICVGEMNIETLDECEKYLLTLTVPDEFLTDPDTVYPITIDPTITLSDSVTSGAIVDAPVFENYPNRNCGTYKYNSVGTTSDAYGVGRTAVKLSGLASLAEFQSISANQITNVTFYAKDASGSGARFINLYPLTGNTAWTESGVTWNNVGAYDSSANYGNSMGGGAWTAFDITDLAKSWKIGTYHADAGFIMINENEASNKCFCSSEYTAASSRSYVVITYDNSYSGGDSFTAAESITVNTCHTVNIDSAGKLKYFKFIPSSTGFYTFECTSMLSGDPYGRLYNSAESQIAYDNDSASNSKFRLTYHLISGATYYFTAGCFGTATGIYDFSIAKTTSSHYVKGSILSVGSHLSVSVDLPYQSNFYKFTPAVTGEYLFVSSNDTGDPKIWCYNSSMTLVGSNDDGTGTSNFKLSISLNAGQTYYIVAGHYSSRIGEYDFKIYRTLHYKNYYDSSFASDSTLRTNISTANNFSDYVYSNYFGLKMIMDTSATQLSTVMDSCTTGSNNFCSSETCGSVCNYTHHKNIYTIALELYNAARDNNHLYVYWTNRTYGTTYCCESSGTHAPFSAIAVVIGKRPIIHFLSIYGDTDNRKLACMAICLVHETAHTLGMNDVYNNVGHDIDGATECVMERFDKYTAYEFYQDVLCGIEDPFCDSCNQTVSLLTTSTAIYGNR